MMVYCCLQDVYTTTWAGKVSVSLEVCSAACEAYQCIAPSQIDRPVKYEVAERSSSTEGWCDSLSQITV